MTLLRATVVFALSGCTGAPPPTEPTPETPPTPNIAPAPEAPAPVSGFVPTAGKPVDLLKPEEARHLSDLRQITFGGENAEAYWSPDGTKLIYQRTPETGGCDQQFVFDLTTGESTLVSSGKGRTTCGYYSFPKGERYIYATTEAGGAECPPVPDHSKGYVWPLYDTMDLVWHTPGSAPEPFLAGKGYDAEATVCFTDGRVVFTSTRTGDLELFMANADGTGLKQLTNTPGYDGGAFFTQDCSRIVWRASRPEGPVLEDYQALLAEGLVRPSKLDIYSMAADGTDIRQHTRNGSANFGPYPTPDMQQIIFSSNLGGNEREFDLWLVPMKGEDTPERVTHADGFDGFPMFSPDGQWLVFASNRATEPGKRDTNLFLARWKP
jgi:TolB protein